jgi:predicted deacylase
MFVVLLVLVCGWSLGGSVSSRGAQMLGRSERGRPIMAIHAGDPNGLPVLVVGCIHGNECAGIPVAHALERVHPNFDLWIVPNLNPDGYAAGTRQNARGVDLNRNWSYQWPGGGRPWDVYYPGPRPFSSTWISSGPGRRDLGPGESTRARPG